MHQAPLGSPRVSRPRLVRTREGSERPDGKTGEPHPSPRTKRAKARVAVQKSGLNAVRLPLAEGPRIMQCAEQRMRLALEITTCTPSRTGVGYYTEHLVDALLETRRPGHRDGLGCIATRHRGAPRREPGAHGAPARRRSSVLPACPPRRDRGRARPAWPPAAVRVDGRDHRASQGPPDPPPRLRSPR